MPPSELPTSEFDSNREQGGTLHGSAGQDRLPRDVELVMYIGELAEQSRNLKVIYDFEAKLRDSGYLSGLEEAGILPDMPRNPNPHVDIEAHLLWALAHQTEMEDFLHEVERREEILRYLYIGGVLAPLLQL